MADIDLNGLPEVMELDGAFEDAKNAIADVGDTDLELAGPEEQLQQNINDGTGAPAKRYQFPFRRAHSTTAKRASSAPASSGGAMLSQRVTRAEQSVAALGQSWTKFKRTLTTKMRAGAYKKGAAAGQRALYTATAPAVAAGAVAAITAVVGNAAVDYDRVAFISNTPGLFTAFTAAGNPIIEGSGSIPCDAGQVVGPFECAEVLQLNGNSGVTATFTNRGAGVGDGSIIFIPKGHSFGSQVPYSLT